MNNETKSVPAISFITVEENDADIVLGDCHCSLD